MFYEFECPNCGYKGTVQMRITEYHADGHKCPNCGEEMQREIKSLVGAAAIDKTGGFYRSMN